MALTETDQQLLKQIYQRLKDEPLQPGSPFYEPIYGSPSVDDPVARLRVHIGNNDVESLQLFSGFRGSGKTTELFRLKQALEQEGAVVLYADALEYLNPSEPVEVASLLIAIAGGFSDALETALGMDAAKESFWQRITHYLKTTTLTVTEAGVNVDADSPAKEILGGLKGGVELKFALKDAPSFRQNLARFLDNRLPKLKQEANQFLEAAVKTIRSKKGKDTRIVFIFDQLEQIRGSLSTESAVIQSVERIFATHLDLLKLPYLHAIYTVPPWLRFVLPGAVSIEIVPTVHLWNNNLKRTEYKFGWQAMRRLVAKRFPQDGFKKVFGNDPKTDSPLADQLIASCGGHFRDLQRLLRELIVRIQTQSRSLPATKEVVKRSINEVRAQYLPIALEDAQWLAEIEKHRTTVLRSVAPDQVSRLSRFLDTHFVLYFSNAEKWYDIHPLIREEVARLSNPAPKIARKTTSRKP
jgi:hypothetical protein